MDAIITVRTGSTRLPSKCFLDLHEGLNSLDMIIGRLIYSNNRFDNIIVATTDLKEDDRIEEYIKKIKTKEEIVTSKLVSCSDLQILNIYRGNVTNKFTRWSGALKTFNIEKAVFIDADDPVFDPDLVAFEHAMLSSHDYVTPDLVNVYLGSHGFAFNANVIHECAMLTTGKDVEMIWKHIPEKFSNYKMSVEPLIKNEYKIRLTLDYEEDLSMLRTVFINAGSLATRDDIVSMFKANKNLFDINSFRNDDWKEKQDVSE